MRTVLIQPRELFGPPERQAELEYCWRMNDMVFNEWSAVAKRPTFNDLFALCDPDAINIIANADIYFDEEGVETLNQYFSYGITGSISAVAFALSRWDVDAEGRATLWDHPDSQDAWVFHGKPTGIDAPFPMGVPGCDNHLAWLIERAGYRMSNPSRTVRAYHFHNVQWRSYLTDHEGMARGGHKQHRIPPPYKLVKPAAL